MSLLKRCFLLFLCVCVTTVGAAWREPVRTSHGMVASTERIASQIGVDVMKRGGNAVDAAVAVAFALAVVYPVAGNLGGGGFMMIRRSDGTATAIDYREMAPAAAIRDMYVGPNGELIKGEGSSTLGYRAAGVPGTVAGLALALKQYGSGKLTWSELIEPARRAQSSYVLVEFLGDAEALRSGLRQRGISVMWGPEFGLTDRYFRLEVSEPENVRVFIDALRADRGNRQSA